MCGKIALGVVISINLTDCHPSTTLRVNFLAMTVARHRPSPQVESTKSKQNHEKWLCLYTIENAKMPDKEITDGKR